MAALVGRRYNYRLSGSFAAFTAAIDMLTVGRTYPLMTHGSRYLEPGSTSHVANDLRVFQFSLTALFVTTTATALVLTMFFGVGSLIGMSTTEVVRGLVRLVYAVPTLLVWIAGLALAFRCKKQIRVPATLTLVALSGLVLSTFVFQLVQMALIHSATSNRISNEALSWGFAFIGILHVVLKTCCWVLILMAIFVQRRPYLSDTQ